MTILHALMNGEHAGVVDGQGRPLRFRYDQDLDPADASSCAKPGSMPSCRGRAP